MMSFTFVPGLIQSPGDPRDYIYRAIVKIEKLPVRYSLRWEYEPARNQGNYGTCVGFAAAAIKDSQETRNYSRKMVTSPLFVYTKCKKNDGIPFTEGTYPRVAMKVLKKAGICCEGIFPYSEMNWPIMAPIPNGACEQAKDFRIGAYASIKTIDEVKQAIVRDGPVLGGIMVYDNFLAPSKEGIIEMPRGKPLGGHAVCVIGYDDEMNNKGHRGYFEVRNSWGTSWGDNGYGWIPYDFFEYRNATGIACWLESWSCVDIILPPRAAGDITIWLDKDIALVDGKEVELGIIPEAYILPDSIITNLKFMAGKMGYLFKWSFTEKKIRIWKP